jgi:uncharacterized protein (TIGR00297 family)
MIVDWRFKNFLQPARPRKRQFRTDEGLAPVVPVIVPMSFPMIVAFTIASLIAGIAHRLRLLTASGAVAAAVTGAATVLAGWSWAILLLFFFTTSTALSRWRAVERDRLVTTLIEKQGPRDAVQVLANGGLFSLAALLSTRGDAFVWQAVAAGAIAAATSDTWSTEVGIVLGGKPRAILSGRQVAPGTSGGITMQGTMAALTGAFAAALLTTILRWPIPLHAVFVGGFAGSIFDSVLGATVQERRWCQNCNVQTERRTHSCGTSSVYRGGIRGCDNDVVNLMTTIAGAVITWRLA